MLHEGAVTLTAAEVVSITGSELPGIQLKFTLEPDEALAKAGSWDELAAFNELSRKDNFEGLARTASTIISQSSQGALELVHASLNRGSISLILTVGVVKDWLIDNTSLFGAIKAFFGLYDPLKQILENLKTTILPHLVSGINQFVRKLKGFLLSNPPASSPPALPTT